MEKSVKFRISFICNTTILLIYLFAFLSLAGMCRRAFLGEQKEITRLTSLSMLTFLLEAYILMQVL